MKHLAYGLELDCVFFVGELQGKERLIMSHIIYVIPPAETMKSLSQTHDGKTQPKNTIHWIINSLLKTRASLLTISILIILALRKGEFLPNRRKLNFNK